MSTIESRWQYRGNRARYFFRAISSPQIEAISLLRSSSVTRGRVDRPARFHSGGASFFSDRNLSLEQPVWLLTVLSSHSFRGGAKPTGQRSTICPKKSAAFSFLSLVC